MSTGVSQTVLTFGSLFAGIGGFDAGFEAAGLECVWQVEKEPSCVNVLARHWPQVHRWSDVREFNARDAVRPDVVCGGFPCQDLSVAGNRAGLAGKRSGLWEEFRRIIGEFRPEWVVIENVPGLLSSNEGRDLGTVLGGLEKLGHGFAYRVFDAQFWRVPQRRRRVFIVGHSGDWRRAAEILFEPDSLPWDSPPSEEAGPGTAGEFDEGADGCGEELMAFQWANSPSQGMNPSKVADPIRATRNGMPAVFQCHGTNVGPMGTLRAGNGNETGGVPFVLQEGGIVRRMTPRECERLQGFPDDWTRWGANGKELTDSPRYRMIGNAVCRNVAEWIGRRIVNAN